MQDSKCPLPAELWGCAGFSRQRCVRTCTKYCQPRKLTQTLVSRFLLSDLSCSHAVLWLNPATQTVAPRGKQASATNTIVNINSDQNGNTWPNASGQPRHFIRLTLPRAENSSPRGWPRAIPEVRPFLKMCRV